ncbi:MAG TPA: hypothetical protein VM490_26635 [Armatimonadaceae bacterium]|nr:hypothetical protein [Armatimonadaceae bacterium]
MSETGFGPDELGQRAKALYEREIRDNLSPIDQGKYLVIDVETGEYEIDADEVAVSMRAYRKNPEGRQRYCVRLGRETTGTFRRVRDAAAKRTAGDAAG